MRDDRVVSKKIFVLLWLLCVLGSCSVLPYSYYLGMIPPSLSVLKVSLLAITQGILFFGLICWASFKILPNTDLHPFHFDNLPKRVVYPAVISGVLVGLIIFLSDKIFFGSSLLAGEHPPFWTGALASVYGAVNEEVLLRLFLFTLIYWIFQKIFRLNVEKRQITLWITNILVALIFGLGHLPAAFKLMSPSVFEISRILLLNGIAGVVFGWLYWSRGLWTAMAAHFVADLMIHVFLI